MSESENKALMQRWFEEVWNQGKESTIDELFRPQRQAHGLPTPDSTLIGPEAFKAFHRQFQNAFGNLHVEIRDILAEGNRVALHWTLTANHSGDGLGFPATGRDVTLIGSTFVTCHNGQITEAWNFMDLTKLTLDLQAK